MIRSSTTAPTLLVHLIFVVILLIVSNFDSSHIIASMCASICQCIISSYGSCVISLYALSLEVSDYFVSYMLEDLWYIQARFCASLKEGEAVLIR